MTQSRPFAEAFRRRRILAVLGPRMTSAGWNEQLAECAAGIGQWAAENAWVVLCGGLSGAGQAAVRACHKAGGLTIALPPQDEDESGAELVLRTRLGVYRNFLIAHAADAGIAVGGGAGTLQEASQIHDLGRPIAAIGVAWTFPGLLVFPDSESLAARFLGALSRQ
jgi:uncharacterized protein (TIGR00725 family)